MKKIIFIVFLFLFQIELSKSEPVDFKSIKMNINELVKNGYIIKFVQEDKSGTIFVLEKNNNIVICQAVLEVEKTWCYNP